MRTKNLLTQEDNFKVVNGYEDYLINSKGEVYSIKNNIYLHTYLSTSGYKDVMLYRDGIGKRFTVHRLIAKHFIGNPQKLRAVNHLDGNKLNNHIDNLEWCSHSMNSKHAWSSGLMENTRKVNSIPKSASLNAMWNKNKIKVKHLETGIIFNSITEASEYLKVDLSKMAKMLKGTVKNKWGVERV